MASPSTDPVIERGYHEMYDLNFDQAHKTFAQWEQAHPADPLGPASNAAAYLFAEFDRLNILQSELFVEDGLFRKRPKVAPDPAVRLAFDNELAKADKLIDDVLSRSPEQPDALFAKILALGLRADYTALIERRDLAENHQEQPVDGREAPEHRSVLLRRPPGDRGRKLSLQSQGYAHPLAASDGRRSNRPGSWTRKPADDRRKRNLPETICSAAVGGRCS